MESELTEIQLIELIALLRLNSEGVYEVHTIAEELDSGVDIKDAMQSKKPTGYIGKYREIYIRRESPDTFKVSISGHANIGPLGSPGTSGTWLVTIKNGHVVDASQPLDDVVKDVQGIVLEYMAERTRRRMRRSSSC